MKAIYDFFNWKNNPNYAALMLRTKGDPVYLHIFIGAIALLAIGLYHPIRYL